MSRISERIERNSSRRSKEERTSGLIGHVIRYHPEALVCNCEEHKGKEFKDTERHTADIKVFMGKKEEILKRVPCMVYSQGVITNGLIKGDRVFVQFINGDTQLPVITAFYREPSQWNLTVNTFKYGIASFFSELF